MGRSGRRSFSGTIACRRASSALTKGQAPVRLMGRCAPTTLLPIPGTLASGYGPAEKTPARRRATRRSAPPLGWAG